MHKALFTFAMLYLGLAALFQTTYDRQRIRQQPTQSLSLPLLLPVSWLRVSSLGFKNTMADVLWVQMIQEFAYWRGEGLFPQYIDRITTLDPQFEYPYLLGILMMPRFGQMQEIAAIAERGMRVLPENWQIPFYLGAQYHIVARDTETALRYVALAAQKPSSPPVVKQIQAIYSAHTGELATSRGFFAVLYATAKEEETKNIAREWLERLDHIEALQEAVRQYAARFGRLPASVQELQERGIIQKIPSDLNNFTFVIDERGVLQIQRK